MAGLGAGIAAMSADDVAEFSPAFALAIADALCREADFGARQDLTSGLAKLATSWRKPDPTAVRSVVELLVGALKAEREPARCGRLAQAAASMADRLSQQECATICRSMVPGLSSYANSDSGFDREEEWIRGLGELMIRVPADVSIPAARLLAKAAASVKLGPSNDNAYPARAFYAVVDGMNADDAARTAPVLVAALGLERDPRIRWWLEAGLGMMVTKMDPDLAARLCGPVLGDIGDAMTPESYVRRTLINAFTIVASRQPSAVAGRSAHVIAGMITNDYQANDGPLLVRSLAAVAGRMEPVEAEQICGDLARRLAAFVKQYPDAGEAAEGIALMAARMKPDEARQVCGEACALHFQRPRFGF